MDGAINDYDNFHGPLLQALNCEITNARHDHAVVFRIHSVSLRLRLIPGLIDFAAMAFPLMGNRNREELIPYRIRRSGKHGLKD